MSVSSWQTETKFNRRDALVALAVALLAAVTALLFYLPRTQSGHLTAVITQHGQVVRRVALSGMDKEQVIELDDGTYHLTVCVSADGAYVSRTVSTPGSSAGQDSPSCAFRPRWWCTWRVRLPPVSRT